MGNQNNSRKRANDGFSVPSKSSKKDKAVNKKTTITAVCMLLVVALFVGVIVYSKIADSGVFYRNTISVSSENFEVNNAMLSYFFNTNYQQMASYLQQAGIDTSVNLKNLQYSGNTSWFDYFMDQTISQVKDVLVLCEAAKAEGFELTEDDHKKIDEAIDSIQATAKAYSSIYGGTELYYIRNLYGYGVNLDDIRDALELSQLATAYSTKLTDSYDYTEAEWEAYLEEHHDDFLVIDYLSYTFKSSDFKNSDSATTTATTTDSAAKAAEETTAEEGTTASTEDGTTTTASEEEEKLSAEAQAAKDAATAFYKKLLEEKDDPVALFNDIVKKHLEDIVYASTTDADKKKESVETALEGIVVEADSNSDDSDEFYKFAFDEKRELDAFLYEDDTNGRYIVFYITKAPYIEEYVTRNVRVIVKSAAEGDLDDLVEAVLDDFEKTDKSEKAFEELVKKYSYDSNAEETGGLYENQGKGDLNIDELNDWLYDEERKVGDYTHKSNGQTGTNEIEYIVYYTGEGLIKWQRDVDSAMITEAFDKACEEFAKTHPVEADLKQAYKIPSQAGL